MKITYKVASKTRTFVAQRNLLKIGEANYHPKVRPMFIGIALHLEVLDKV